MSEPSYEYKIALVEREIQRLLLSPPSAFRDDKINKLRGMQRGFKAEQIVVQQYEREVAPLYHGYEAEYQEKLQKSIDEAVVQAVTEGVQAAPQLPEIQYSSQPYSEEFASLKEFFALPPIVTAPLDKVSQIQFAGFSGIAMLVMAGIAWTMFK